MKIVNFIKKSFIKVWYGVPSDIMYALIILCIGPFVALLLMPLMLKYPIIYNIWDKAVYCVAVFGGIRFLWFLFVTPFITPLFERSCNHDLHVFRVSRSLLHPHRRWVSQRYFIRNKKKTCPIILLGEDKKKIMQMIEDGNIYYMESHDETKDSLKLKDMLYSCKESCNGKMKTIRKILVGTPENKKRPCANCKKSDCRLFKLEEERMFYFMKARKKN